MRMALAGEEGLLRQERVLSVPDRQALFG